MLKSAFILACAISSAVASGLLVARFDSLVPAASAETVSPAPVAHGSRMTAIPKSADGHFWAEARVNTTVVKFLIDTGASVVALTPEDARRLGVDLNSLVFDQNVTTAMGQTRAAHVTIDSLSVGQSRMTKVEALVIPEGLSTSLLGMSYLGRLSRFEATPRALILHP